MRCPLDHIHGAATARVANWVGGVHPKNVLCASVAFFLDSEVHWLRSVLAWCAFPPAGVSQNAKVLSCVQGGPCNHGLDQHTPHHTTPHLSEVWA